MLASTSIGLSKILLALLLLAFLRPVPVALAERQNTLKQKPIALVIGNSAYRNVPKLANPQNDANDMAEALTRLGFEVLKYVDLDRAGMERALEDFTKKLNSIVFVKGREAQQKSVSVFYYAGHAIQVDGENYLIPIDAEELTHQKLGEMKRLKLQSFVTEMAWKTETNILFLDACRDNPLGRGLRTGQRSSQTTRGLAAIEAGPGTLISYSTAPGETASDGDNLRNSPYTQSLKRRILTPNKSLPDVLIEVAKDVKLATNGKQKPWQANSLTDTIVLQRTAAAVAVNGAGGRDAEVIRSRPTEVVAGHSSPSRASAGARLSAPFALKICTKNKPASPDCIAPGTGAVHRDARVDGVICDHCPQLVAVPAGAFIPAGKTDTVARRSAVRIEPTWLIGRHEVSFEQWDQCVAQGGCADYAAPDNGWGRGNRPVINVSYDDAKRYVAWLSKVTGARYDLPTEAQWSYAARAGRETGWWWGDVITPERANFDYRALGSTSPTAARKRTVEVDRFDANPWGLKNVHGNVAEWTSSCAAEEVDPSLDATRAAEWARAHSADCGRRIVRGGAWDSFPAATKSAARTRRPKDQRRDNVGFRVIRWIEAAP